MASNFSDFFSQPCYNKLFEAFAGNDSLAKNAYQNNFNQDNIPNSGNSESGGRSTVVVSWTSPLQWESEGKPIQSDNETFLQRAHAIEPDSLFTHPFYLFMTCMSCIGNIIIITVICSFSKFRKPANLLIVNLSFSSILLIVSVNIRYMEFSMDLWAYTDLWCRVLAVLHRIPVAMVALTTMAMSIDRGRVARNPLTKTCGLTPILRIILIWSFSVLIACPLGFSRRHDPCIRGPYKCSKTLLFNNTAAAVGHASFFLLSVYLVPSVILIHESVKTLKKLSFLKTSNATWTDGQVISTFPDTRLRLLRNSCIFSVIFLVFWLPFGVSQFLIDLPKNFLPEIFIAYVNFWFKFAKNVTYVQITSNPVILFLLSYDFRKYWKKCRFTSVASCWRCIMAPSANPNGACGNVPKFP